MGTDKNAAGSGTSGELAKFRDNGIQLVRAGGDAGQCSAIIPGWLMKGPRGTDPVTREITT